MNITRPILYGVLIGAVLFALSCFKKPKSLGGDTILFVVADSTDWQVLQPTFSEVFEKVIKTPQPEKVFKIVWVPPRRFSEFATKKNLVLTGALQSSGDLNQKIQNMLSLKVKNMVEEGSAFVFPKNNPWADNQLLVVLVSNTLSELQSKLLENKEYLYNLFKEKLLEETRDQMYYTLEQTDLADRLLEKFGWTLRIQHDYIVNVERTFDQFVMLRRSLPGRERWLFVHWIEEGDPNVIEEKWIVATRNKLTAKFYENDRVVEGYTKSKETVFLNRNAVMLEGLWENEQKQAGGPFRTYCFYDEPSARIYLIDIAVFFPGGEKEPFLRQLDIMAHSFKTAQELKKEKGKEAS
ncbi:MAG: DUF4837 family protein [bacterium]